VQVTFNVGLPDTTPVDSDIYMGGSFNGWNPGGTLMTRSGITATLTLSMYESDHVEYKYTLGSWDFVEKDLACGELNNRVLNVVYGADGTMTINDVVANWRNIFPCGN
jgi:hypothetical protein